MALVTMYWRKKAVETPASSIFNVLASRKLTYSNPQNRSNYDSVTIAQALQVIDAFELMNEEDVKTTIRGVKLCRASLFSLKNLLTYALKLPRSDLSTKIVYPVESAPLKLAKMSKAEFLEQQKKGGKLPPLPLTAPGDDSSSESETDFVQEEFDEEWTCETKRKAEQQQPEPVTTKKARSACDARTECSRVMADFEQVEKKLVEKVNDAELEYNAAKEKYEARKFMANSLHSVLKPMKDTLKYYVDNGMDCERYVAVCDAWIKHTLPKK